MAEEISVNSITKEKAAATKLLKAFLGNIPEGQADREIYENPVLRLAQLSLEHIEKHGGKLDPSLISALANSEKHDTGRLVLGELMKMDKEDQDDLSMTADVAHTLAVEMLASGLVELPVVARGRGRG